jgi:hypothetical protein
MTQIFKASAGCILGLALAVTPAARAEPIVADSLTPTQGDDLSATPPADSESSASPPANARLPQVVVQGSRNALQEKNQALDESRDKDLLPKAGATTYNIDQEALQALPQGKNTPIDKVLLQTPGVSYDSAISNPDFHIRNEYANVQYRINGIQLPDGVSALGPVLETGFIGNLNLLDGTLPAQYGLRTAGVVDITTKSEFDPGGNLDLYGGTWATVSPSIEYGGSEDQTQYFVTGLALFQNTVQQPVIPLADPVRPERATYFDVGIDQQVLAGLAAGLDVYYKRSTDTLDDGQFGQAVVLNQFNYARGFSRGAEFKLNYYQGGLRVYANLSGEETKVKEVVSNQYLIGDPVELAYLASTYTYASDAQTISASLGSSYRWSNMLASIDGIYGSGLRAGFANEQHSPGYTQWNGAVARYFYPWQSQKPLSLRLSVINLFDHSYVLRSATGVGEFAPQYGPRRALFAELTQQF